MTGMFFKWKSLITTK
jgi:antitoxin HigA-1